MAWTGIFLGALAGLLLTRNAWFAVLGAVLGYLIDEGGRARAPASSGSVSVASEFFRTTFELMGYVAKSDGRVSEAEIDAARGLMQELRLGPQEINAAIGCFRVGKAAGYDVELSVERLRKACGRRNDLLRAFMELQVRAALAGNDISPPARAILIRVADRLGLSGLEFAHMEASIRARRSQRENGGPRRTGSSSLAECYAELEVADTSSNQEVIKAYRRQMSRHHPDKLVANGLPESMAQMAKEKTQRIQEAYEHIRAARGMT